MDELGRFLKVCSIRFKSESILQMCCKIMRFLQHICKFPPDVMTSHPKRKYPTLFNSSPRKFEDKDISFQGKDVLCKT